MDFLKKAANWLGGAFSQGARAVNNLNPVRLGSNVGRQARRRPEPERQAPPPPRIDYRAAMQALQSLQNKNQQQILRNANPTNITKPFLGVTVGDIARQVPRATGQIVGGTADFATKQFFPATRKLAEGGVNTAQALQMRTNLLANQLRGKKVNQEYLNRIAQLEQKGLAPERIRTGKASVGEFGREIVKTGTPVGLEVAPFLGGATQGVAKLGLKQAAPKILKEGLVYGGTKGAYTLGFGEGDIKQRGQQAATDVVMGPLYELLGYGFGRGIGKIKGVKNADEAIQARLKNRPGNLRAIEQNPNLTNAQRLNLAQGDTGQAGLRLSPAQREAMLAQFQGKVRTVNGKKVFAPTYNPTDAPTGKLGRFSDNVNPRDKGKFTANPTDGYQRVVSQRELDIYNKTGKFPANPEGMTNVIKPGEIGNIKGITDSKKYLVTFRNGLKIVDESGPQAAVKGGIDRKFVSQIEPYVPRSRRGPVLGGPIKNEFQGDLSPQVGKTDPLEALKAEARKSKDAESFARKIGFSTKEAGDNYVLYKGTGGDLDMGGARGFDYMKRVADSKASMPPDTTSYTQNFVRAQDYGKVRAYTIPKSDVLDSDGYMDAFIKQLEKVDGVKYTAADIAQIKRYPSAYSGMWRRADKYPSLVADIKKSGYKAFKDTNGEIVVLDKKSVTDLYNQATKPERYNELVPKSYLEPDAPKGKLTAKEKAMGKALGLSEADTIAAKQGGNGLDRGVNLDGTPIIPGAPKGQVKRGFVKSLQDDWGVPSKVADSLPQGYKPIKNADTFAKAKQIVDSEPDSLQRLLTKPKDAITELDQAQLQIHLRKAIEGDNFDSAKRIATKIDVNARQAGRTVQILAAWKKTTPEGALSHAYKVVEEANTKYPGKNFEVTPEKAKNIRQLAENIQKTTAGTRERQVSQALLEKEIKGIVPATIGRKLSSLQTFAQLLNPKTAIRNVIGNAVFGTMENISTATAAGVDKLIGVGTKQRSVALPSLGTQAKGFLKGAKYGIEDTNLGIRTSGSETQFEVKPNVFKNKILKGVEKVLGYELSVPDKAFYQGAFEDSLNNQMRAMKLDKPNALVIEQANQEALYRTFQNDSRLAQILSGVKRGLNFNKEFGAGDFILKYPRTPGNIAQAGLWDYSPLGGAQGLYRLGKGIKQGNLDPFSQREAALQIGRGITGTGLLAGGAALAKGGVLQGRPDTDKDVNNLDRSIGGGPYTFNVSALGRGFQGGNQPGDKILNYDWLQPTAIPVTMGANLASRKTTGDMVRDVTGTIDAGVQTLVDQPVLQGLARIVGSTGTGGTGIGQTLLQTAQSIPSSFMPSILNQIGQYTDPISRSTYDPNFFGGALRQVQGRVPGLRTQLQPNMDTFGNERKMYEDNNFFNVFFNPAFQRTYQPTPEAQLVLDLNQQTGETTQFPRVAPRKLTINGEQTTLTPEQITAYQKYTGEKTKQWYQNFNADSRFKALSNEDKIKVMQNALTDIAAAGKIAVLGQNPEGADSRVKAIAENRAADFIPKPKKVKQPKAPKPKRGRRKSTRKVGTRTGRRRSRRAVAVVPKVPRLTSGIKTSSGTAIRRVSAKRSPRLKFASAPKSSKTVKIKLG